MRPVRTTSLMPKGFITSKKAWILPWSPEHSTVTVFVFTSTTLL